MIEDQDEWRKHCPAYTDADGYVGAPNFPPIPSEEENWMHHRPLEEHLEFWNSGGTKTLRPFWLYSGTPGKNSRKLGAVAAGR